jgi:RNA polymerase sigma-70 factor (ECF subfamily)
MGVQAAMGDGKSMSVWARRLTTLVRLAEFGRLRPRLLGVAHRIVGSWAEAEDVVQDASLRWQSCDRRVVLNPTAYLVTTTARLAINVVASARARRETPLGSSLPELVDASDLPAVEAERREALQRGIRLVLQRLAPTERAAYVLRQAFDYPYPRIAALLQTSEDNARQLVSRAGRHITVARPPQPSPGEQRRLVHVFRTAAQHGALGVLEDELSVAVTADAADRRSPCRPNLSPRPHRRLRSVPARTPRRRAPLGHIRTTSKGT